jgi:hypothetical protein
MKDDLDKWTASRDGRIKADRPAVDQARGTMDKTNKQTFGQRYSTRDSADSKGPPNVTGVDTMDAPSRVPETSHTQPDAVIHVASLHNYLLLTRAALGGVLPSP